MVTESAPMAQGADRDTDMLAAASTSFDEDDSTLVSDGMCLFSSDGSKLVRCIGAVERYRVPDGCRVICDRAFFGNAALEIVEFPQGLEVIGDSAFENCVNLAQADLPDTLISIGDYAFYGTVLEVVRIPAALDHLGELALLSRDDAPDERSIGSPNNFVFLPADYSYIVKSARVRFKERKPQEQDAARAGGFGSDADKLEPCLPKITVSPENQRFRILEDCLCEKMKDGRTRVVQYAGAGNEVVVIPREATWICAFAFRGARNVTELHIHDAIGHVDDFGLTFPHAIDTIHVHETDGSITIAYPYANVVHPASVFLDPWSRAWSYVSGTLDVQHMVNTCDNSLVGMNRGFERTRRILDRLSNGQRMIKYIRDEFMRSVTTDLDETVAHMARIDDLEGIRILLKIGVIDKSNLAHEAVVAAEAGGVAVAHLLLEQKRKMGGRMLDLDL